MGINGLPKMLRDRNTPTDKIRKIKGCTLGIDSSILSAVFLYSNANAVERYHMVPRMPYLELIDAHYDPIIQFFNHLDINVKYHKFSQLY